MTFLTFGNKMIIGGVALALGVFFTRDSISRSVDASGILDRERRDTDRRMMFHVMIQRMTEAKEDASPSSSMSSSSPGTQQDVAH
jgi:hypothetical protein